MQELNLPEFDAKTQGNEIFCLIRKKWIVLTPEEWVRQHFLNLLINHLKYPKGLMKLEHSMSYFKNQKRSDISILKRDGGLFLLVECKSTVEKIDEKVVKQVSEYNKVLNADYFAVTNGLKHFIWKKRDQEYFQMKEFPVYQ